MSLCASCGLQLVGDAGLCPHHVVANGDDWAEANRLWCAYFHRGEPLPRLPERERDPDFWVPSTLDAA